MTHTTMDLSPNESVLNTMELNSDEVVLADDWSPEMFQSLMGLSEVIKIVGGGLILLCILGIFVQEQILQLLDGAESGEGSQPILGDGESIISFAQSISLLHSILFFAFGLVFLVWFYKAYKNSIAFQPSNPPYPISRAILAWFSPILTVFRPFQITKWMWKGLGIRDTTKTKLLGFWWAAWLSFCIMDGFATNIYKDPNTIAEATTNSYLALAGFTLEVLATIFCIRVVRMISQGQEELAKSSEAAIAPAVLPDTAPLLG